MWDPDVRASLECYSLKKKKTFVLQQFSMERSGTEIQTRGIQR